MAGHTRYRAKRIGPLCVDIINTLLNTELEPAEVWLSNYAHRHLAEDHPDDYELCLGALSNAVISPTYVGQDPRHGKNFYLVHRVITDKVNFVLIAIGFERNDYGNYNIRSAYTLKPEEVETRKRLGRLVMVAGRPIKKGP